IADLDDDGDLDFGVKVYVALSVQHTVVFTNTGGTFVPASGVPGHLMSGDVDGDGMTDLCVQDQTTLHVLRRIGPGAVYAPPVSYVWRHARRAADLDQDGDVDLLGEPTLWNRRFDGPTAGARRQYGTGGAGTGGRRPLLSLLGPLRSGLTTNARVVAAPGGSVGVLFVSAVEAHVPQALPGVTSWIGASFPALVGVFGGAAGQPGAGAVELPIAIPPGVNGARLFLQFLLLDPAMPIGLGYSNGCELFVGL
ncbi:MAG TPA: VCBS repeat-containing protein, partial [Planctomycetota bacterium]|nr:VCBS repeat-containing protein [Planctomycetota bacterium]